MQFVRHVCYRISKYPTYIREFAKDMDTRADDAQIAHVNIMLRMINDVPANPAETLGLRCT